MFIVCTEYRVFFEEEKKAAVHFFLPEAEITTDFLREGLKPRSPSPPAQKCALYSFFQLTMSYTQRDTQKHI